jgi:hypothetical protein
MTVIHYGCADCDDKDRLITDLRADLERVALERDALRESARRVGRCLACNNTGIYFTHPCPVCTP